MTDSHADESGEVTERPRRRSRRAKPGHLAGLDPADAAKVIQRSAERDTEPRPRRDTPVTPRPAQDDATERAIVDALATGFLDTERRPEPEQDGGERRRFLRRRRDEELPEPPGVPVLEEPVVVTPRPGARRARSEAEPSTDRPPAPRRSERKADRKPERRAAKVNEPAPAPPADPVVTAKRVLEPTSAASGEDSDRARRDRAKHADSRSSIPWRRRQEAEARAREEERLRSPEGIATLADAEHAIHLRRAAETAAAEQAAHRLVAEESALHAAEARLQAELAAQEHAAAAEAAATARAEAEEVAARQLAERRAAEETALAATVARTTAEESAREHATRAASESQARTLAETQAAEQATLAEAAHAARLEAERSAEEHARLADAAAVALERAETAAREQAVLAEQALQARQVAEQRALELVEENRRVTDALRAAEEAVRQHAEARAAAEQAAAGAAVSHARAEKDAKDHADDASRAASERRAVEERYRSMLESHETGLAEALAARTGAEAAAAEHARVRAEAEESAARLASDRSAVEAAIRRHAELAEEAVAARVAAEERALELARALEATREVLLQEVRSPRHWWQQARPVFMPEVRPPEPDDAHQPDPAAATEDARPVIAAPVDADETIRFRGRRGGALLGLTLAALALVGAIYTATLTMHGDLLTPRGIVASLATIVLVFAVSRTRTPSTSVWIDRGIVHVATGDSKHRFDLTSPNTTLEVVGTPRSRGWKMMFLRRSLPPYVLDARSVDPVAFTDAVRRWRPEL